MAHTFVVLAVEAAAGFTVAAVGTALFRAHIAKSVPSDEVAQTEGVGTV